MAKYTPEQKREAVRLFTIMGKEGTCYFNDETISNIRALCSALGISSQSLYRWAEEFDDIDEEDILNEAQKEYSFKEFEKDIGLDFDKELDNLKPEIEPMTFKMGTTFFQTLAQGLGIKNYRMPIKQLYLKIGSELIKLSGLVENGVREELRIE